MIHPKVSVITPSFNQGEFIERTILSVGSQDYPNIEHIVIDGGSTDSTLSILREYEDSIIWKSEPDKGQPEAINKGFLLSTGEIVAWLNSDDTYQPSAVRRAVDFLSEHPDVGMVYGDCRMIDEKDEVIGHWVDSLDFDLDLLTSKALNYIPQPTVFFRREILDTIGLLDVNLQMAMDYDYWIRIGQRFKVKRIPVVLGNFRVHQNAKSSKWFEFWPEILSVVIKHCGLKPLYWYFKRYYNMAKSYGYTPFDAYSMLEKSILHRSDLHPHISIIKKKGLSLSFMDKAHNDYLMNRRYSGLKNLLSAIKMDSLTISSGECFFLVFRILFGYGMISTIKSRMRRNQQ